MRARRLIPWILSAVVHGCLVLLLMTVGVFVMRDWREQSDPALADGATFSFEAAPSDSPPTVQSAPITAAIPVRENVANTAIAMTAAHDASREILAFTEQNRDSLIGALERTLRPMASPRSIVTVSGLRQTSANRIVYLLDASGSMIGAYPTAVQEVINSITRLSEEQQFAVVAFQGGEAFLAQDLQMRRAGPTIGQQGIETLKSWLLDEITPGRDSDVRKALRVAIALRPDTIVIVSAGLMGAADQPTDRDSLLADLDALNPKDAQNGRRKAQIACIHLMEAEPLGALEAIAREHGGPSAYRFVRRMADLRASDEATSTEPADETTHRLDQAIALLKAGDIPSARIAFLRIGITEPLHRSSPVALVSAAEISLLNDRDPRTAVRLAGAALRGAQSFGLETTAARAETVIRASKNSPTNSSQNP